MSHASIYPLIISFYTPTWEYPYHAERLRNECSALGLDHHIVELPPRDNWLLNTKMKPKFIRDSLRTFQRPVLWIDVDGSIYNLPSELCLPVVEDFRAKRKPASHSRVWHVGTMFFNYTPTALAFVDEWATRCETQDAESDELVLDKLWRELSDSSQLTSGDLPTTYFHMLGPNRPPVDATTVIAHRESRCSSKHELRRLKII